jgi:O-antigen ligase
MSMDHYSRPPNPTLASTSIAAQPPGFWLVVGLAAHLPLAILMRQAPLVATIHGWSVFALGLWFLIHDKQPTRLIYLTGYIVGAEVLWRMTKAGVFWEFGKYSISFLLLLAMVKWPARTRLMPLFFGLLFIPSMFLTFSAYSFSVARSELSFNTSGPILLTIGALFFSGRNLTRQQMQRLLLYFIFPICCIAILAFFKIQSADEIEFGQSNFITSGGYGPNQVSAVLGLGAMLCWLYILGEKNFTKMSWLVSGLLLWFLGHTLLTFSRGGLLNFLIAGCLATPFLALKRRNLISIFMLCTVLLTIFFYIVIKIDAFTGYTLQERYTDTGTTGRTELMQQDLRLWQDNFLFGVGPGLSPALRAGGGIHFGSLARGTPVGPAPHTEYTRILAEHGLFGLIALLLLFFMFFRALVKAPNAYARGLTLAFMVWALVEMTHAAMRLAAISYLFSLPFAKFEDE